jgi:hypothetical protein
MATRSSLDHSGQAEDPQHRAGLAGEYLRVRPGRPKYVEIRGTVSLTDQGGPELIDELSRRYTGKPYQESHPDNIRVVCRVTATKTFVH